MEVVQELIKLPFARRAFQDQMNIVRLGPPRPNISHHFDSKIASEEIYSKAEWITACSVSKGFYCWPCLLFSTTVCIWNKQGVVHMVYLLNNMHAHEISVEHIQADLDLKLFYDQNIKPLNLEIERDMKRRTETAKSHRKAIKVIIDAVCCCVAKEKISIRNEKYSSPIHQDECVAMLNLIRNYDTRVIKEIGDAIELVTHSSKTISDLTDSITRVVRSAIKEESHMSTYVSIILSEHSEAADRSLVSTVLRYLKNGLPCERFVGFTNACDSRLASDVYKHISSVVKDFELADRFLAYSLDGGVLPLSELSSLNELLKANYPYVFFVPWYCHKLDYVLQHSLMCFKDCRVFFKGMEAIKRYFRKKSRRYKSLDDFMCQKRPTLKINHKWFNGSSVCIYRKDFIEYFDCVVGNSKIWEAGDIANAFGFCYFLQDQRTVFLLKVFNRIFDLMSPLQTVLKGNAPDSIFATYHHDILKKDLTSLRDTGFDLILCRTGAECDVTDLSSIHGDYRDLFTSIINHTIELIEMRFDHLNKLEFCHMLNHDKYMTNCAYRVVYISKLMEAHGMFFDKDMVYNELDVLQKNGSKFPKESHEALHHFFLQSGMQVALPNLFKLGELRLTLPIRSAGNKNISKWACLQEDLVLPGDVSVLCVESDLFKDMQRSDDEFHDKVVSAFSEFSDSVKLM